MGNLLSKRNSQAAALPPKGEVTAQDRAILDLKLQRDKLRQYQKKVRAVMLNEEELARKAAKSGERKKALLLLKKKRYQMTILDQADNQILNIEQLVGSIEYAQIEIRVLEGLKIGNTALAAINKEMNLDDVEKIMQDTEEAVAYQNELADMLGQRLTLEDEAAIEAELEALDIENGESKVAEAPTLVDQLPDVPTTNLPAAVKTRTKTKVAEAATL